MRVGAIGIGGASAMIFNSYLERTGYQGSEGFNQFCNLLRIPDDRARFVSAIDSASFNPGHLQDVMRAAARMPNVDSILVQVGQFGAPQIGAALQQLLTTSGSNKKIAVVTGRVPLEIPGDSAFNAGLAFEAVAHQAEGTVSVCSGGDLLTVDELDYDSSSGRLIGKSLLRPAAQLVVRCLDVTGANLANPLGPNPSSEGGNFRGFWVKRMDIRTSVYEELLASHETGSRLPPGWCGEESVFARDTLGVLLHPPGVVVPKDLARGLPENSGTYEWDETAPTVQAVANLGKIIGNARSTRS